MNKQLIHACQPPRELIEAQVLLLRAKELSDRAERMLSQLAPGFEARVRGCDATHRDLRLAYEGELDHWPESQTKDRMRHVLSTHFQVPAVPVNGHS